MAIYRILFVAANVLLYDAGLAWAQSTVHQNMRWEASFTSTNSYANPFTNVTVQVQYTKPGSEPINAYGFWDGGNTFRIRNAFPEPGTWQYQTISSDPTNAGLHNQSGTVEVLPYTGDNPLYKHGFLQVSDNRRYLEHADGTPFLWVGETLWSSTMNMTEAGFRDSMDFMKSKDYNVLLTNLARHSFDTDTYQGGSPEGSGNGNTWDVSWFQKLDREFNYANDQGIYLFVNALVDLNEVRGVNSANIERFVQMVSARYYGHHISYSASMDDYYRPMHDTINNAIHEVNDRALLSQHGGSPQNDTGCDYPGFHNVCTALTFYDKQYEDYVMYTTGRTQIENTSLTLYEHEPHKPVIHGESAYEGLIDSGTLVTGELVARQAYMAYLTGGSGFSTGTLYWNNGTSAQIADWKNLPGHTYMQNFHGLIKALDGGRPLVPQFDVILNQSSNPALHMALGVSEDGDTIGAFLPVGGTIRMNLSDNPGTYLVSWYNTLTGAYTTANSIQGGGSNVMLTSPLGSAQAFLVLALAPLGDYNGNGVVGPEDFDVWRYTFGMSNDLRADGNGNGIVDTADYVVWRDRLGTTASFVPLAASVPEPATWLLGWSLFVTLVFRARGRRSAGV